MFEQSMGAGNRVGIGLSYRPAKLRSLAESIPGSGQKWFSLIVGNRKNEMLHAFLVAITKPSEREKIQNCMSAPLH